MNATVVPLGQAYCVDLNDAEAEAFLTFSGQVDNADNVISFANTMFNYIGNCTPITITLGDIDASDDFYNSSIQFLTEGGATATVDHPELGTVEAIYKFFWAEDAAAGIRGWYLAADESGAYPMNDVSLDAGDAFCVDLNDAEAEATVTIPAAL